MIAHDAMIVPEYVDGRYCGAIPGHRIALRLLLGTDVARFQSHTSYRQTEVPSTPPLPVCFMYMAVSLQSREAVSPLASCSHSQKVEGWAEIAGTQPAPAQWLAAAKPPPTAGCDADLRRRSWREGGSALRRVENAGHGAAGCWALAAQQPVNGHLFEQQFKLVKATGTW